MRKQFKQWLGTIFISLSLILPTAPMSLQASSLMIKELEFKGARLVDAIRIIAELSGDNIVATPDASRATVTLFLRDISVKDAIETICRVNNLWYRYDSKAKIYRILTGSEYANDLVIHRDDSTRIFTLRNPNVELVSDAVANLYGRRVRQSTSGRAINNDSSNSNNNDDDNGFNASTNSSSSGNQQSTSSGNDAANVVEEDLSIDQLASLKADGKGLNLVSATQLQQLSAQKEPIFITRVPEHNLLVVRSGDKQALEDIAELIEELDRPVPQVMLEMKILDILVDDDFTSIFNFELTGSGLTGDSTNPIRLGNSGLGTDGSLVFEYLSSRLKANIEFLQLNKKIRVLSTPLVLASNNRTSKLFIGEEQVIVSGYQTSSTVVTETGAIVNSSIVPETELREVGNTIEITPYINDDGTITLQLKQENSTVRKSGAQIQVVVAGEGAPTTLSIDTVSTANLEGTVIAEDGYTVAVGGLIRETENKEERKVPLLGDLPGLGKIFTSVVDSKEKSELVLLITPHILRNGEQGQETSHQRLEKLGSDKLKNGLGIADQSVGDNPLLLEEVDKDLLNRAIQLSKLAALKLRGVRNTGAEENKISAYHGTFKKWRITSNLTADSLGSLFDGEWHVTTLKVTNSGTQPQNLSHQLFKPRWLSVSFDQSQLEPGETGHAFIVSDKPLIKSVQSSEDSYVLTEYISESL